MPISLALQTPFGTLIKYTTGPRDFAIIFFYFLISIVIHAVVQEYFLDVSLILFFKSKIFIFNKLNSISSSPAVQKINRKLHLSKTKHSKFNESGQLLTFILISLVWAGEIIRREGFLLHLSKIWANYPQNHADMEYLIKFYYIIQIAYWAHQFPELYFQKVKSEEMAPRIAYASLYLVFFAAAYALK